MLNDLNSKDLDKLKELILFRCDYWLNGSLTINTIRINSPDWICDKQSGIRSRK
jgi:hypothetical protein